MAAISRYCSGVQTSDQEIDAEISEPTHYLATLVLPCLNEEKAIGNCVTRALAAFNQAGIRGSVLVVDNGSTDNSVSVASDAGARLIHQPERGYGAALRSGFEHADSTYVIMADGDGTYELEAIPQLLQPLIDGKADLVLGSRLDDDTKGNMPWLHRHVGTPTISWLIRLATGGTSKIRDSQSGFRAFRRDDILALNLVSTGMEFASEMLIHSSRARLRIFEVPTRYAPRIGESKLQTFRDGFRHLRKILLLSPEIFAVGPGILMTLVSIVLWILASMSTQGLGRVGTLSWLAILVGGILSVIGPLTYCTGLIIEFRAESLGFRHTHAKYSLVTLIWRYFYVGVFLLVLSALLIILLVVNFHHHPALISVSISATLASITRSAAIVGIMLTCAPVLLPFLIQGPVGHLPEVDEEA